MYHISLALTDEQVAALDRIRGGDTRRAYAFELLVEGIWKRDSGGDWKGETERRERAEAK